MIKELEPFDQWTKEYWIKVRKYRKKYCKDNYKKLKEYSARYYRNRYRTDLKFNLNSRITGGIRISLKGNKNGRHWENLVGYTTKDLIKRLQKTMPKGYDWNDYLEGKLQIDHIIPKSVFNYTKPEHTDFKRCWALSNLQLLPAKENLVKNNKLSRPFQLALQI